MSVNARAQPYSVVCNLAAPLYSTTTPTTGFSSSVLLLPAPLRLAKRNRLILFFFFTLPPCVGVKLRVRTRVPVIRVY